MEIMVKNILFCLLILFSLNISVLTLTNNCSAMTKLSPNEKKSAQEKESTQKPKDKLTIEKDANGVIIIRQNPAKKSAD